MLADIHCTNVEKESGIHLLAAYQNVEQILQKKIIIRVWDGFSIASFNFLTHSVLQWLLHGTCIDVRYKEEIEWAFTY